MKLAQKGHVFYPTSYGRVPIFFCLKLWGKIQLFSLILLDLAEIIKINPDLRFPGSIWGFLQGKLMTQLMVCLLDKRFVADTTEFLKV